MTKPQTDQAAAPRAMSAAQQDAQFADRTKGRWELRGFGAYIPGTQKKIAEASLAWKTSAECQANARLIAAAPSLLARAVAAEAEVARMRAALEEIVARLQILDAAKNVTSHVRGALDVARAALKAGE